MTEPCREPLGPRPEFGKGPVVDKRALYETLKGIVRRDLATAIAAAKATKEGATHEENKPENDKDTRAIEASYLAGAQGERVRELEQTLAVLEALPARDLPPDAPVGAGAVVRLSTGRDELLCLVALAGGGLKTTFEGASIQVVSTKSPLGSALVGAHVDDEVEVELGKTTRTYTVLSIE